ncbi:hypothetical protein [Phenylobacterium sp.]|uniref:hypothetical protein n=1 Tax=Phenylobacterium sp. TaxID=1871053 RepID=UPI002BEDECF8|nr:hypothetical protein [Phenylobacterium sp.]HVI33318.1 hypothetical protein [Phenylobacterium sp.]
MIRTLTLAAAALLVAAAPAAAKTVRISTAGKTAEQVQAEVTKAARSLCLRETFGASFPVDIHRACVRNTVEATMKQFAANRAATQLAAR